MFKLHHFRWNGSGWQSNRRLVRWQSTREIDCVSFSPLHRTRLPKHFNSSSMRPRSNVILLTQHLVCSLIITDRLRNARLTWKRDDVSVPVAMNTQFVFISNAAHSNRIKPPKTRILSYSFNCSRRVFIATRNINTKASFYKVTWPWTSFLRRVHASVSE